MKIKYQKFKDQNGTAIVEFAVILPLLLLVTFGVAEFSLILYDKAMITNASREGARAGIVFRATPAGDYDPVPVLEIQGVVDRYLRDPVSGKSRLVAFGAATNYTTSIPTPCAGAGTQLRVNVTYNYDFLILPKIAINLVTPLTLTAETVMRCE